MFTLTSTTTKLAVLAFSAAMAMASFQSVAVSFNSSAKAVSVVELPTVVVVGKRDSIASNAAQAAAKISTKTAG